MVTPQSINNEHEGPGNHELAVGVAVITACLVSAGPANADVITNFELLTSSPVPANGVLRFPVDNELEVRVVATDGSQVAGSFVEQGIWRPDQPFAVGTYTADLSYQPKPARAIDSTFEVTAAQAPNYAFIDIQVASAVSAEEIAEEACCGAGSARNELGEPCSTDCKPLCVPTAYTAKHYVDVYYAYDSDDIQAGQTRFEVPDEIPTGQYKQGHWPVSGSPSELCGVAQVFSWLDGTTQLLTKCIPNPKPDLSNIGADVSSFGDIVECTVPPAGYEDQWCVAQAYACESEVETLDGSAREERVAACTNYFGVCDHASTPTIGTGEPTLDATDTNEPCATRDADDAKTEEPETGTAPIASEPGEGCACEVGHHPTGLRHELGLIVLGALAFWRRLRLQNVKHILVLIPVAGLKRLIGIPQ